MSTKIRSLKTISISLLLLGLSGAPQQGECQLEERAPSERAKSGAIFQKGDPKDTTFPGEFAVPRERRTVPKSQQLYFSERDFPKASTDQLVATDLVGLNLRRFETNHNHPTSSGGQLVPNHQTRFEQELKRAELIESKLASIPDQLLSRLPDPMVKQVFESFSADPSLFLPPSSSTHGGLDPDEVSIERLTKSCLTIQASSQSAEQLNVTFHLFTRQNPSIPFIMRPSVTRDELLRSERSPFRPDKPIKWITHGFHTNLDKSEWMLDMKDKVLAHEDANVILTNWGRGASPALAFYPRAAANAHVVAKMIVKLLRRIRQDLNMSQVHLIGHSLGAHIMGFVGSAFTEEYLQQEQIRLNTGNPAKLEGSPNVKATERLIGRITACDPALPCFGPSSSGPNRRLSQKVIPAQRRSSQDDLTKATGERMVPANVAFENTDDDQHWITPTLWTHLRPDSALLVEVLHSNPGVMGYAEPLGDFDFYPNGSGKQPGCSGSRPQSSVLSHGAHPPRLRRNEPAGSENRFKPAEVVHSYQQSRPRASSLSQTLERLTKPIRDFFTTYTCSHHRSVEYMVESMYYNLENDPPVSRVCQMVGYRCASYRAFKKGQCFVCQSDMDCRSFGPTKIDLVTKSNSLRQMQTMLGYTPSLAHQFSLQQVQYQNSQPIKRSLPSSNYYHLLQATNQHIKPAARNEYFFDTKSTAQEGSYCLNHYHFLIKYRWFRIRDKLRIQRLRLVGSISDLLIVGEHEADHKESGNGENGLQIEFNAFTRHSYTMLQTTTQYLGKLEALIMFASQEEMTHSFRPQLIEYIEVSFLSNLSPQVRRSSSARFCLAQTNQANQQTVDVQLMQLLGFTQQQPYGTRIKSFTRCQTGTLVRKRRKT